MGDEILKLTPLFLPRGKITSKFGHRELRGVKGFHSGIDIGFTRAPVGLYCPLSGVVMQASDTQCGGGLVSTFYQNLSDGSLISVYFGHLSRAFKTRFWHGDNLKWAADSGDTGSWTTGHHLHVTVKLNDKLVDPLECPVQWYEPLPGSGKIISWHR